MNCVSEYGIVKREQLITLGGSKSSLITGFIQSGRFLYLSLRLGFTNDRNETEFASLWVERTPQCSYK